MTIPLAAILSPFAPFRAGFAKDLCAQLSSQSFEVIPETATATVGDSLTVRFRVRLHERDKLLDTLPQVADALPAGVRVLSVEKLTDSSDRVFHGRARLTFYRPGRRPVPVFQLPFMRVVEGITRATLPSDSAFVEIKAVLPAGDPPLKDIKEPEPIAGPRFLPLIVVLLLISAGLLFKMVRRRRPPTPVPVQPEVSSPPVARSNYEVALERLAVVESDRWAERGQVPRHYEAVVDVLREYLDQAEGVAARERTTSELLWSLPPHLTAGGLRGKCHELMANADLVKFAKVRPSKTDAAFFLHQARQLLETWHRARPRGETAVALR